MSEVGDAFQAMSARQRGALLRAVRRGSLVAEADRPVAVAVAEKELDRLNRVRQSVGLSLWRIANALAAAGFAFIAASVWHDKLAVAGFGATAVIFGTSALLARRRLDRQVTRLAAARDRNATHEAAAKV